MIPVNALLDTLLNILVFAYLGTLIWLYLRSDS